MDARRTNTRTQEILIWDFGHPHLSEGIGRFKGGLSKFYQRVSSVDSWFKAYPVLALFLVGCCSISLRTQKEFPKGNNFKSEEI